MLDLKQDRLLLKMLKDGGTANVIGHRLGLTNSDVIVRASELRQSLGIDLVPEFRPDNTSALRRLATLSDDEDHRVITDKSSADKKLGKGCLRSTLDAVTELREKLAMNVARMRVTLNEDGFIEFELDEEMLNTCESIQEAVMFADGLSRGMYIRRDSKR